jgi:hypothetical protein
MEAKLEDTRDKVNTEMGRIVASIEELESHLAYLKAGPLYRAHSTPWILASTLDSAMLLQSFV